MYFHGGGYVSGRKELEARAMLSRLASHGWVCVSANYGLRPTTNFPATWSTPSRSWPGSRSTAHASGPTPLASSSRAARRRAPRGARGAHAGRRPVPARVRGRRHVGGRGDLPLRLLRRVLRQRLRRVRRLVAGRLRAAGRTRSSWCTATRTPWCRSRSAQVRAAPGEVSSSPVVYAELPGAQHGFDLFHSMRFDAVVAAVEEFAERVVTQGRASEATRATKASVERREASVERRDER
ncbi:alpha/beta hydrolase fold domain-containing protein [Oerskovia sp. M15]